MEVVESMEMAPRVNPRPDRVSEQELLTPETCLEDGGSDGTFRRRRLDVSGFLRRRQFIDGRARLVGARWSNTTPRRGPRPGRA